jgi:Actinobacteria/chloroflexi VLRF1 release factor
VPDPHSRFHGVSGAAPARRIEVDPERIVMWVNGFAERHGELTWTSSERSVALSAADGATAVLEPFGPGSSSGSDAECRSGRLDSLAHWAAPPTHLALILVRRGGYAVGLGDGQALTAHKVGTRYVQSRTAAGGWSQQRFARRRKNQADGLVGSVIEHARRVVLASPSDALVVGGDKGLIRDVLADARLSSLAELPRRELYDLPDPKLVVLERALRRARAVRIALTEPGAAVVESASHV